MEHGVAQQAELLRQHAAGQQAPPGYLRAIANGAAQAVVQLALLRPVALFRQRLADIEKQLVGYDVALKIVACRHF